MRKPLDSYCTSWQGLPPSPITYEGRRDIGAANKKIESSDVKRMSSEGVGWRLKVTVSVIKSQPLPHSPKGVSQSEQATVEW